MAVIVAHLRHLPRLAALLAALVGAALPDLPVAQEAFAICPAGDSTPGEDPEDILDADLISPPAPTRARQAARSEVVPGDAGALPVRPSIPTRTGPSRPSPADPIVTGRGVRLRC
jgi:hypothetical protein